MITQQINAFSSLNQWHIIMIDMYLVIKVNIKQTSLHLKLNFVLRI